MGTRSTLIFLAILSGEQTVRGIAAWNQRTALASGRVFKLKNCRVLSDGTVRRVLAAVDIDALEAGLSRWARELVAEQGLAVDGKTRRGSGTPAQRAVHLLSAFSTELGVVIGQRLVDGKHNEIPEARTLLESLMLTDRLVTLDALHTQRETAQTIVEKGGAYLMTVKDNQPRLWADLKTFFEHPAGPGQDRRTVTHTTRGHGRLETRTLSATAEAKGYLDWRSSSALSGSAPSVA